MSKITSEKLIELINKSQLAELDQIQALLDTLRKENGGQLPSDPVELTKKFEDAKLITRWQSEKLLQGKYKGYFLGRHKLLGHIGRGGMSSVYLAEHTGMMTKRAIKVLPKSKMSKSSYLARFQREAKAIASLNHVNIVRAYDIDNEKDTHYIVMEYVEGADLQETVKKDGPLPYHKAAEYIRQAALGLQHAHDSGLIHRDVKPANLLIRKDGQVKVLDLGLALFADETQASLTIDYNDKVLGTADYLAPEQALNSHDVDYRADMYGLGCTLYFALTGHPPFPDGSIAERIAKHQKIMPATIRKDRPDCPGELEGICVKMMQKDKRYRYSDCNEVAEVLAEWLTKYKASKMLGKKARSKSTVGGADSGSSSISSSVNLDSNVTGSGDAETVSSRGTDTLSSKSLSGASIVSLSASDSGVLRSIANRDSPSDLGSAIDLQREAENRRAARKNHQTLSMATRQRAAQHRQGTNTQSIKDKAVAASTTTVADVAKHPGIPVWLLISGILLMFVLAILIGVGLGRFTAPDSPAENESPGIGEPADASVDENAP
jgi:serine/threonine-protein kinase